MRMISFSDAALLTTRCGLIDMMRFRKERDVLSKRHCSHFLRETPLTFLLAPREALMICNAMVLHLQYCTYGTYDILLSTHYCSLASRLLSLSLSLSTIEYYHRKPVESSFASQQNVQYIPRGSHALVRVTSFSFFDQRSH